MNTPNVHIIAGPNGAGKTTFAAEFLPKYAECSEFVNADMLAQGLSPFAPEGAAIQAGRLMLDRIERLASKRIDFGFETTLSGRMFQGLISRLKDQGYSIHLYFLWLPSVELAIQRVAERVKSGGHNVPEKTVRRRFKAGLENFIKVYSLQVDEWILFDNSAGKPEIIARLQDGDVVVNDEMRYNLVKLGIAR